MWITHHFNKVRYAEPQENHTFLMSLSPYRIAPDTAMVVILLIPFIVLSKHVLVSKIYWQMAGLCVFT
jgi:hypothetical protein